MKDSYTRLYRIWAHMKDRCNNPKNDSYKRYGGSGVKVCSEWYNFKTFKAWALSNGYAENLTIDRINVYGDYEPTNCRWADMLTQNNNRRNSRTLTYNGETHTISEWARIRQMPYRTIHRRLELGFSIPVALGYEVREKTGKRRGVRVVYNV